MRYPAFRRLAAEMASLTRYAFQRRCWELLRELWPDLIYARELGNLDTKGIDLYVSKESLGAYHFDVVVQCKGLEVPRFGEEHLQDCIMSMGKFASSGFKTNPYYFIVNRLITESVHRKILEDQLRSLVECHKAGATYLLDLQGFTQFLLNSLIEILLLRIQSLDAQHFAQYEKVMGKGDYVDEVPFIEKRYKLSHSDLLRLTQQVARNPYQHLLDRFRQRFLESSEHTSAPSKLWTLIISEFGFGKTCLLLRLGVHLWHAGLPALYVPFVEIPRDGFVHELALVKSLLRTIVEQDEDANARAVDLWAVALSILLRTRADFVLLLDGLDEHRDAYSHEGIRRIFDCLRDYVCSIALSMRQELWDERHGNPKSAIEKIA